MDAKDLRIETALGAHTHDGSAKYAQSATALQNNGNKTYHNIGSNSLGKVDVPTARPCAIIGPDRIVPPLSSSDVYLKKIPVEPWPCMDNGYQHQPEYSHKPADLPPTRNISPRQTFQENMQRIMVPPTYASVKNNEDRSLKSSKLMPSEAKYCDVPYTISPINNEPKISKSSEGLVLNNNSAYTQHMPPNNWSGNSVNVRPLRSYGAPELYQYSEYPNCPGPRPISMIRPHRNIHEEMPQVYQDRFYPEANVRFKPYPSPKERSHQLPQARYDYIANYPNAFHLHSPYTPKYDLQKSMPPHAYPVYQPVPLKYLDRRMPTPNVERFQRSPNQQVNFSPPFCNQNIPSNYGSVPGNCLPNRTYPYTPDPSNKPIIQNRVYFDGSNTRKYFPNSENMYINDVNQLQAIKNDLLYQTYPPINIQPLSPHHIYRKENPIKGYEQSTHFRNIEYAANMNSLSRVPLQFSPQTISISPESNTSNDASQILSNAQEDCGYVSQSSTASVKSMESGINRLAGDRYRRQEIIYDTIPRVDIPGQKVDSNVSSKEKKGLNVRQFLQMWNEGDEGSDKETSSKKDTCDSSAVNQMNSSDTDKNQEQLYVLDLVNVPNEELSKYEHIQKISKLPENIKGYNNIELLNQYEKLVESPGMNHFTITHSAKQKEPHVSSRNIPKQRIEVQPRPISPLDVEAKISQSVIHKEVGCNFEIRPCSPQMLNVEIATPVHNVLGERLIEKVVNPNKTNSPMIHLIEESNKDTSLRNSPKVQSCKLVTNQYMSPSMSDTIKTNYCLQDLESNSGICLASLPRLDNDIELNFPEINQQFINANKIDSIKTSAIPDLPILDTENRSNVRENSTKVLSKPFSTENSTKSASETDKEVSKLSKYRKQKKCNSTFEVNEADDKSTQHMPHNRTDSVIIKNPENTKSPAQYSSTSLNNTQSDGDNTIKPINVLVEGESIINESFDHNFNEAMNEKFNYYISTDVTDTAIDFSLNKNDEINYINNINSESDSLQNTIETGQNIFVDDERNAYTNNVVKINSPKELNKTATPTEFNISEPNSPIFANFDCPDTNDSSNKTSTDVAYELKEIHMSMLDKKKDFKEIDENEVRDNTDVTHSNTEDVVLTSESKLEEEVVLQKNLSTTSNVIENNATKNMKSYEEINKIKIDCDLKPNEQNHVVKDVDHLNCEDIVMETSSVSVLTSQNNLSISFQGTENVLTITKSCDSMLPSNSPLSDRIKNQISTTFLAEKTNSPKICESNISCSEEESLIDENKTNIENNPTSEMESKDSKVNVAVDNVDSMSSQLNIEHKNLVIEHISESHIEKNQRETNTLEVNIEVEKVISTSEIKTSLPTLKKEEEINCPVIKKDLNIDLDDKEYRENNSVEHLTITKENILDANTKNDDIIKFEQNSSKPWKEGNVECCDTSSLTTFVSDINIQSDFDKTGSKSELDIVTIKDNSTEKIIFPVISYQTKQDSTLKKELFSPWVQKLLLSNDGFCISPNILDKTLTNDNYSQRNDDKSLVNENNGLHFSIKSLKETFYKVPEIITNKTNKSVYDVVDETIAELELKIKKDEKHCELEDHKICTEANVDHNEILLNNIDESYFIVENNITDTLSSDFGFETENDEIEADYNIDLNVKLCDTNRDIPPLNEKSTRSQCLNRRIRTLKRSLSESAVTEYTATVDLYRDNFENNCSYANKRTKLDKSEILVESHVIAENFSSFIQTNRRNSISTFCNDENVSFCILIDNDCVLAEENENTQKICYTELPDDYLATVNTETDASSDLTEAISSEGFQQYSDELILQNVENKSIEETWIDDVACIETVFSDDIAEDIVISASSSPKGSSSSSEDEKDTIDSIYNVSKNEHANKLKYIYGNQMSDGNAQLVEKLYRTPQMDVNKTLVDSESQHTEEFSRYYDNESLEQILSESNTIYDTFPLTHNDAITDMTLVFPNNTNIQLENDNFKDSIQHGTYSTVDLPKEIQTKLNDPKELKKINDCHVYSCESSNNFVTDTKEDTLRYAISSSPEVSSTTSEEKNSAILLKIRSYKGTKISEINEMSASYNQGQSKTRNNNNYSSCPSRPLLTKAAQKYIPPLKETIRDLKVKLRLPKHSLYKLQQLKKSKEEPKIKTDGNKHYIRSLPQENPKKIKPKPKFEDVLKSIDEIQFKMHKEKHKKVKQSIPKVIIKKNENGAHYASTQSKETFNPDLTGRKWQPWVFLEKSHFIDKMALKQKFKAIYSHRKKTYVLAENFRKYKSISNSKFVISHPTSCDNLSTGKLKYTFKLKHN